MPVLSNPKHELFAQEMARGQSATDAYTTAGYKPDRKNAAKLRQRDDISHRIAELLAKRDETARVASEKAAERLSIDREWVLARLVENANRAMQAGPVKTGGKETGEYRYDGAVANRALELIGKELGMFIERSENVNVNHVVRDDLPTQEEWEAEHSTTH